MALLGDGRNWELGLVGGRRPLGIYLALIPVPLCFLGHGVSSFAIPQLSTMIFSLILSPKQWGQVTMD
jgi:hypothetical protein